MPVTVSALGTSPTIYQVEYGLLREMLRNLLAAEVESSRSTGRPGRVACGAGAALDSLLAAHPVDKRGRCRSCRRPGWLARRRRKCLIFQKTHYWLRAPAYRVQAHLDSELGMVAPASAAEPQVTRVPPGVGHGPVY